jgi:cell wall-associated NlpC family hydrolase
MASSSGGTYGHAYIHTYQESLDFDERKVPSARRGDTGEPSTVCLVAPAGDSLTSRMREIKVSVPSGINREAMMVSIIRYLETPYKYGGTKEDGMDCSAFTGLVYGSVLNISLPRTARDQFLVGKKVDKKRLKFGDLVFFKTRRRKNPSHVGIYVGEDLFAHASRGQGITISSLSSQYYSKRYVGARRVVS